MLSLRKGMLALALNVARRRERGVRLVLATHGDIGGFDQGRDVIADLEFPYLAPNVW